MHLSTGSLLAALAIGAVGAAKLWWGPWPDSLWYASASGVLAAVNLAFWATTR